MNEVRPLYSKLNKKLKKQLKKLSIDTQGDLINLMIGVVARRIGTEDIEIKNWLEGLVDGLTITYKRMDDGVVSVLSDYDLSIFVSESDSFLSDMRRSETGSFYTPIQWVKYMTRIALYDWVATQLSIPVEKAEAFVNACLDPEDKVCDLTRIEIDTLFKAIKEIKVVDIACGAGAFLLEMVSCITKIHICLADEIGQKTERNQVADFYLSKCVVGLDLQAEPLIVYTLCLMWTYGSLEHWKIRPCTIQANSLSEGLFELNTILSPIINSGGFDIVIGNPPYLGEKGNTSVFKSIRETAFGRKHYEGKMDLSYFFTLKSLEIMKPTGSLTYLTTNYFITADGAVKYRASLKQEAIFAHILNFNSYPVFKEALGQHNMIYLLKKRKNDSLDVKTTVKYVLNRTLKDKVYLDHHQVLQQEGNSDYINAYSCAENSLYNDDGTISILSDDTHREALLAYESFCTIKLKDEFQINQGIVSGADQVSGLMLRSKLPRKSIEKYDLEKGQPIFVFNDTDKKLSSIEQTCLRPFYKNSDIGEYNIQPRTHRSIIYLDTFVDDVEYEYPETIEHLSQFKPVLENRREVKTGTRPWYALQWPRKPEVFEGPKIVVPQRCKVNRFAFTRKPFYASADVYYFKADHLTEDAWYYYLGLLNASIMYLWLYHNGKRKGELLELYAKPLLETAVPKYDRAKWQVDIARIVEKLIENEYLSKNDKLNARREIDQIIFSEMLLRKDTIKTILDFRNRHNNS